MRKCLISDLPAAKDMGGYFKDRCQFLVGGTQLASLLGQAALRFGRGCSRGATGATGMAGLELVMGPFFFFTHAQSSSVKRGEEARLRGHPAHQPPLLRGANRRPLGQGGVSRKATKKGRGEVQVFTDLLTPHPQGFFRQVPSSKKEPVSKLSPFFFFFLRKTKQRGEGKRVGPPKTAGEFRNHPIPWNLEPLFLQPFQRSLFLGLSTTVPGPLSEVTSP